MARVSSLVFLLFVLAISTPAFAQSDNIPTMSMPVANGTCTKPPLSSLATHSATGSSSTGAAASGTGKPGSSGSQNTFAVDAWGMILSGICIAGVVFNGAV